MDKRIRFVAEISVSGEFIGYTSRADLNLEISPQKQQKMVSPSSANTGTVVTVTARSNIKNKERLVIV